LPRVATNTFRAGVRSSSEPHQGSRGASFRSMSEVELMPEVSKRVTLGDSLVSTKLRPSQARPKLVARPRLVNKLDREPGRRLTLVSAPAGFGKTTLLGKWVKDRTDMGRAVVWLSLDEDDNDPARFLRYLVAAIGRGREGEAFGEGILAALRSPELPRIEALAGALVDEVASLPSGLDLVLDDYHIIESEAVHRIVSYLLEYLPEDAHLVVSGRVDPPLPLARLRAHDQMIRLGASELAFILEEAVAFLRGVMELDLSRVDIANLEERTEGWIAGLQLAAAWMMRLLIPRGNLVGAASSRSLPRIRKVQRRQGRWTG
jgi:LuxR family maltose regulon positive regulatory protein